jgi:hypothetical protein
VPEVCKLEAQGKKKELFLIILSALSFQPKLQWAAHLIQEIVQEKTERE